jgi:hypothetical protein
MPVDRMPVEVLALRSVHHHVTGRLCRLRWRSGVKLVRRCRRPRHAFLTGSPDSCQHPFGSGASPYPASYPPTRRWRPTPCCPRFPVAFRPPAFASGSSFARCGVGPSSRSGYRGTCPDRNGVATFHTHEMRPGWAPPIPRQRRCSYGRNPISRPPPAAFQRHGCYHPTGPSHPRGSPLRGIKQGFTPFARPVFPSPVAPGMERGPLGLNPELRTPPLPATHVRTGTGHGTLARSYTLDMIVDLQSVHSLVMCDLVSHRERLLAPPMGWRCPAGRPSLQASRCVGSGPRKLRSA